MTWIEQTLALVQAAPRELTLNDIAKKAGVKADWLSKWINGKIENPGIQNVQRVHDFLAGYGKS